jgi:hypothetical protein
LGLVWLIFMTLAFAGPSALADQRQWTDPGGDMTDDAGRAASRHRNADMRRVVVAHRRSSIVIHVKFRDLARKGRCVVLDDEMRISRKKKPGFSTVIVWAAAGPSCEESWTEGWNAPSVELVRLWGRTHSLDWAQFNYRKNFMHIRIPRAALRRPRWVRLNFYTTHNWVYYDEDRGFTPRLYRD